MDFPWYAYIVAAAAGVIVTAAFFSSLKRKRSRRIRGDAYVDALKLLVDGKLDAAFDRLQQAVRGGAAPVDAYIRLGNLLRARGESGRALQIHQSLTVKTTLTRSEKIELFTSLATDYAKTGNSTKAVSVLETAIRNLGIKSSEVFLALARHRHVIGEDEGAYEALKEARKLDGITERELALFLATQAETVAEKGELKSARKLLQRALRHDADCAPALLILGDIARDSNNLDEAVDRWRRAAVLSPPLAHTALHRLETTLFEKGRFSEMERIYAEIRSARVADEAATLSLAGFYRKQGRGEDAIQLLEDFVAVYPDSVRGTTMLALFYNKFRDADVVESFLDKSLKEFSKASRWSCRACELQSTIMRWHCPRCNSFDSFSSDYGK